MRWSGQNEKMQMIEEKKVEVVRTGFTNVCLYCSGGVVVVVERLLRGQKEKGKNANKC